MGLFDLLYDFKDFLFFAFHAEILGIIQSLREMISGQITTFH